MQQIKSKLIADSGSTKTDWIYSVAGQPDVRLSTQGINPFLLEEQQIEQILQDELSAKMNGAKVDRIEFYGAGCRGEQCAKVIRALQRVFHTDDVLVESDMLGAAKCVCGNGEGIVCILGTGSNSCLYDGQRIVANVSPLGFILGDEGSGAVLGRRLVGDVLKKQLPEALCREFQESYGLTSDEIVRRVYREQFPNRFLASFCPFLSAHRDSKEIHDLILDEFSRFLQRNVAQYGRSDLPVNFVGSIAYWFKSELEEAAARSGFTLGKVVKSPIDSL